MIAPYFFDGQVTLHLGDCREVLSALPSMSADAVVCDPPYELRSGANGGFMGQAWDATGIAYDVDNWKQVWRVLKPGGHLLAFGATRTYHRLAVAIEDAGFEIRDSIHWIYGNGFPKGIDVGRAVDRVGGASPKRQAAVLKAARLRSGLTLAEVAEAVGCTPGSVRDWEDGRARAVGLPVEHIIPSAQYRQPLADLLGYSADERRIAGVSLRRSKDGVVFDFGFSGNMYASASTEAGRTWDGWNTTLKPAHEPIVVARKPVVGTVTTNVLEHGTGALNVDSCRVSVADLSYAANAAGDRGHADNRTRQAEFHQGAGSAHDLGRWPTNVVFSHSPACSDACAPDCPVAALDDQTGILTSGFVAAGTPRSNRSGFSGPMPAVSGAATHGDSGGGSRFFPVFRYEPKAPSSERPRLDDGTVHTTVKPLDLMRWLVRLVTPPGGMVLDPFAGSGTTLEACVIEGFHAIGIEKEQPYAELCVKRLSKPIQAVLGFDEEAS